MTSDKPTYRVKLMTVRDDEHLQALIDMLTAGGERLVSFAPAYGFSGYYYFVLERVGKAGETVKHGSVREHPVGEADAP